LNFEFLPAFVQGTMEKGIQQLVEMVSPFCHECDQLLSYCQGATISQARAALKDNKDVMQAAEKIFEGKYDHVQDEDEDLHMDAVSITDRPDPRRLAVRFFKSKDFVDFPHKSA
jgi:hypothetical protein